MNYLLELFKPDPAKEEIQDPEVVAKNYRYWRMRIFYSTFIGYALYYFTRKSFTFAQPGLIDDLGLDYSQLGLLGSILSITYGVSKFASGIISDRANPRYFMAFGLMMTGIINIFFGLSSSFLLLAIFWALNGWFQGFGWPPCAKFLTRWYSQSERGSWWSTWNLSHNVGATAIPWIAGFALHSFGWRYAMYIPGCICILGALFLLNRLRDTPESLGLPSIEKFHSDSPETWDDLKKERQLSVRELFTNYIIKNKYIWLLAISYFFVYIVRTGINDWTALFLIKTKGYTKLGANGCVSLFEIGGLCGSLVAGWSSDRLFGAKRGPVNVIFSFAMLLFVTGFWFVPVDHSILDSLSMFLIGFAVFGPQMLIGVAAAELSHKQAVATATGFAGCFAYLGAAFAGYPLGWVVDVFGWTGFFSAIVTCSGLSILTLSPLWNATNKSQKVKEISKKETFKPAIAEHA